MSELHRACLSLLGELGKTLEKLSELAQQKTTAVRRDDLMALDTVLKQEQALALALRGQEQKRLKIMGQLGLEGVRLTDMPARFPYEMQIEARQSAEKLRNQYQMYQCAAEAARNTLECNLHEIEKILAASGGSLTGPGYGTANAEPPPSMKTDFRA